MGFLIGWIEALKETLGAMELATALAEVFRDPAVFPVLPVYLLAFVWLAHRWSAGRRPRRRSLPYGPRLVTGLLVVRAVAFLTLGLLLAIARSAGRSTFHSGARF